MVDSKRRPDHPWSPADATRLIREVAESDFTLCWTRHASEQLEERGLIVGDVTHVLKRGFVYEEPVAASRAPFYRYAMVGRTPNSGNRSVKVIVIPQLTPALKIVTVMWADESMNRN